MRSARFPSVAVMVLNRNGTRWLDKCLSSLARTVYPELDTYLVDNASFDSSVEYVQRFFPQVKIIRHSRNLGVAEGYNRALESVQADYVVLLNNDTQALDPMWLHPLMDLSARDPSIAAVTCKMVSMADHSRLESVGGMGIPYWRGFVDIGQEERDRGQYDYEGFEPFAFCGGAVLIKRSVFAEARGFDERFFMYDEDVDLSWRLRLLGYRIGHAHQAIVAHYAGGSTQGKTVTPWKLYYGHRNLLRAILKNCGSSLGWALCNYFLYSLILTTGFSVLEPRKAVKIVKALLWNLVNLRNTYSRRLAVQASRKSGESKVLAIMYPRIRRHHSLEHPTLRRILNILFEHSQSIDRFI